MGGEDRVVMTGKELRRVHVIRQVLEKKLTQVKAATVLGLTPRQVRRLIGRVRQDGDAGLVHRARGKPSNRRIAEPVKAKILRVYETRYGDFGPTLAAEKLAERHGITLSDETLRRWLRERGVDHFTRRKRPHRAWRARKAHVGELVQLDGSHHDWLEGRGPQCVLMAYVDDASSRVWARFYEYEGTMPAMDSFRRYMRQHGVPLALYTDKHTTYQSPAEPTVEEQLAGVEPMSQFGRALRELGVELIPAHSPQAKGRVERLFKTFQDRLIKELRLAGVRTVDAANQFLETYLPQYNRQFSVPPVQAADLHRPCPARRELDRSLCVKTRRVLRRDWTVAHHGQRYQIQTNVRARHVVMEERLDGTLHITHQGQALAYRPIAPRPVRAPAPPPISTGHRLVNPARSHPWRKRILPPHETPVTATMP
jgi:transposase